MAHRKTLKTLRTALLFFAISGCLIIYPAEPVLAADKKLNTSNLKVLGLAIGDCTAQDIYSKLGPTIPVRDDGVQLCYVSDRDETLILFSTENSKCTGFRMTSQKKRFYKWHFCEKSSLVSKSLTTERGIKLGMSKSRVKAILGLPESESSGLLNYEFDWNPKIAIRAEFSETGMILFDVSKY